MRHRLGIAGLAATLLAGCSVGPNYHRPDLPVPPQFAEPAVATGAGVDPATWWTLFNDPVLTTLVERALRDSPDMAIAASRVREARLSEVIARSGGLPQVNASANASHIEFSKNAGLSSLTQLFSGASGGAAGGTGSSSGIALPGNGITTYSVGFDASWEIDIFGGVRRSVEAARARTEAATWTRRDAAVTLAAEVAQTYFALRLDQLQAAVVQGEISRQQRALQIAGHIASVGLVPGVDVTRQRAQLTSTQARLEPITADIRVRIHALATLLGTPPEGLDGQLTQPAATLSQPIPAIPVGLPSDLLRRRPDVRAAERNLAAATADIGVAVADLYPRFSLTGMAQLISTALGNLFTTNSLQTVASGAGTFPVLDWGRRRATVGMRREEGEQAYQRYRNTVLTALRDVEDPLAQIDAERRRNAALVRALADAQASAHAIEAQYGAGFIAQDSVLNAQTQVLTAREQLAQSDAQLRVMTAALFKAVGGGWQADSPLPARPDR